jgi:hypothetical protein
MRKEFLADVRADVDRLAELWRKIEWLYENAVANLDALEIADTEDGDTESDYLFAISTGIQQAMDECVEFDAHFRKKVRCERGGRGMNRNNVTLLIGMIRAANGAVSYIQQMAYALEYDGEVAELIADSLHEAYVAIEAAGDKLYEYRATKAED